MVGNLRRFRVLDVVPFAEEDWPEPLWASASAFGSPLRPTSR